MNKTNNTTERTHKRKKENESPNKNEQVNDIEKMSQDTSVKEEEEETEDSEFFLIDTYPKDDSEDGNSNVTFKGTTTEFKEAVQAIQEIMTKPKSTLKVGGREAKIISAPKAAPITVEVTTIKGEVGRAGIRFFSSKTNTVVVTKQRGQSSMFSKALGMKIIKDMLVGLTSGRVTEASAYQNKSIKKKEKINETFKCDLCERIFQTKQGKSIHMTKGHKEKVNICGKCDKKFKLAKSLNCHKEICHGSVHSSERTQREELHCLKCGKTFETQILLNEHMVSHQVFDEMVEKTPHPKKQKNDEIKDIEGEKKRKYDNSSRKCDDCDL